jgi:hypothetical protein
VTIDQAVRGGKLKLAEEITRSEPVAAKRARGWALIARASKGRAKAVAIGRAALSSSPLSSRAS